MICDPSPARKQAGRTLPSAHFVSGGIPEAAHEPRRRVRRALHLAIVLTPAEAGLRRPEGSAFPGPKSGTTGHPRVVVSLLPKEPANRLIGETVARIL